MRRFILTILLVLTSVCAFAQSTVNLEKGDRRSPGNNPGKVSVPVSTGRMMKPKPLPSEYGRYKTTDYSRPDADKLKIKDAEIMEREWDSDDAAWSTACALNTKTAYQKYVQKYPVGNHRAEANKKIVDFEVNEIFNGNHGSLPPMNRTNEDDKSPTSTVVIENTTDYVMTIYFSGIDSKKLMINPKGKATVNLKNGSYRVAASVPVQNIHPYAGTQDFRGGRYETGYCIVPYIE